jgi:hypothetical protein
LQCILHGDDVGGACIGVADMTVKKSMNRSAARLPVPAIIDVDPDRETAGAVF